MASKEYGIVGPHPPPPHPPNPPAPLPASLWSAAEWKWKTLPMVAQTTRMARSQVTTRRRRQSLDAHTPAWAVPPPHLSVGDRFQADTASGAL